MKVLVTGATSYLGEKLCRRLLKEGHTVRAFVRPTSDLSSLPPHGEDGGQGGALELAYGHVNDYPALLRAFAGCEVVFHVAALVEPWLPDPSKFFSVNVGGLKNVLQACRETATVEKIIYTSSFFALGPTDGFIANETQIHPEKFFCTQYEKSKLLADKIALQAAADGLPIVVVYPGVFCGPGKVTAGNVMAGMMIEHFNGRLPGYVGSGKDKFSFSHVEDVVNWVRDTFLQEKMPLLCMFLMLLLSHPCTKALVSYPYVGGGGLWMGVDPAFSNHWKATSNQPSDMLHASWAYFVVLLLVETATLV